MTDFNLSEYGAPKKNSNFFYFSFVSAQGYDTIIPRDSHELTVTQMKQIALARAVLRNPRILLIDDAISGLDHRSEQVKEVS